MSRNLGFSTAGLVVLVLGCGGGDSGPDARTSGFDAPMRTERAYILQRVILPTTMDDVDDAKFEFPGSQAPVNRVGALTKVLLDLLDGIDVQADVDAGFDAGLARQIMVINSGPLDKTDGGVSYQYAEVLDADDPADPSNDFSGSGQFRLPAGEMLSRVWTGGTLDAGELTATGDAETDAPLAIPFGTEVEPSVIPGVYSQARVTVTEDGVTGFMTSAITLQQLHDTVFPTSARYFTMAIAMDTANAATIKSTFDANDDDEVTVQELIDSPDMAALTSPDMDLDGDGTNDHLSQGIRLEAVRAELVE